MQSYTHWGSTIRPCSCRFSSNVSRDDDSTPVVAVVAAAVDEEDDEDGATVDDDSTPVVVIVVAAVDEEDNEDCTTVDVDVTEVAVEMNDEDIRRNLCFATVHSLALHTTITGICGMNAVVESVFVPWYVDSTVVKLDFFLPPLNLLLLLLLLLLYYYSCTLFKW